jgi:hypothetical protein
MIPEDLPGALFPHDRPRDDILASVRAIEKALEAIKAELGVGDDAREPSARQRASEARQAQRDADDRARDATNKDILTTPLPPLEELKKIRAAAGNPIEETEAEKIARLKARAKEMKRG